MHIKKLDVEDYFKGPTEDRDMPGHVWKFGKEIDNKMFYIKIKIKRGILLCCISFHNAKYEINFPYKE